ncbi:hypothetical protein BCR44DRAFT_73918, partial [Catenaria anguillulae PL171]
MQHRVAHRAAVSYKAWANPSSTDEYTPRPSQRNDHLQVTMTLTTHPNATMHSFKSASVAIWAVLLTLLTFTYASPIPTPQSPTVANRPGPSGLPPPSPTAFVRYLGDGTAFIENIGFNYTQVLQQCRGLQGTLPIENVVINTRYPDGRPAYALQFFGDWGCQGPVLVQTTGFTGNGQPLRGNNGQVIVPKSLRFAPA